MKHSKNPFLMGFLLLIILLLFQNYMEF